MIITIICFFRPRKHLSISTAAANPLNDSTFNYSQTHQHDYFEIMFVMDGNTVQKIENQKYLYHTGQCCLLNHAVRHREQPCGNSSLYFLMLSDDFVTRMIQNDLCFNADGSHQQRSNTVYEFFRRSLKSRDKQYMDFYPKVTSERIIPLLENLFSKLSTRKCPSFIWQLSGNSGNHLGDIRDPA